MFKEEDKIASYTEVTQQDIKNIEAIYGLEIDNIEKVASGIANSTYFLITDPSTYVLTIFEDGEGSAVHAKQIHDHLEQYGFQAARRVRRANGAQDLLIQEKPTMITTHIEGLIFSGMPIPPEFVSSVGETLATLHKIPVPDFMTENTRVIPENWSDSNRSIDVSLRTLINDVTRYQKLWRSLPGVFIHGDPFGDNFIVKDLHKLIPIDWATATKAPAVIDIAMALIGNCRYHKNEPGRKPELRMNKFDGERVRNLIAGYESVRKLTDVEKRALPGALEYSNALLAYKRCVKVGIEDPQMYEELVDFADRIPTTYEGLISIELPSLGLEFK